MHRLYIMQVEKIRGILCLNFPPELTWSAPGTILECGTCLREGCFQNIFAGPCHYCADFFDGLYGSGFPARPGLVDPVYFGNMHPSRLEVLMLPMSLDFPQTALNPKYAYSVYDLVMTNNADWLTLFGDTMGVKQLWEFFNFEEYESKFQFFLRELCPLRQEAKRHEASIMWNKHFYKKCRQVERKYLGLHTMRTCTMCGVTKFAKEIKHCDGCQQVSYCSIACQYRDYSDNEHGMHCFLSNDEE